MADISIRTTQNVVIDYSLSSLWERVAAGLIDLVVVLFGFFILTIIGSILDHMGISITLPMYGGAGSYFIYFIIIYDLYYLLMEIFNNGRTVGKLALGIKVIKLNGDNPNVFDFIMRGVLRWIDVYASFASFAILSIASSKKNQRMGDYLGDTVVVRTRRFNRVSLAKLSKINSFKDHTVTFPQVKLLTEEEMLIVKETLRRSRKYNNQAHKDALDELIARIETVLGVKAPKNKKKAFLQTLIRDYVYLTR